MVYLLPPTKSGKKGAAKEVCPQDQLQQPNKTQHQNMNSPQEEEGNREQQDDEQSSQDEARNMQTANMASSQSLKNLESMMVKKTVSKNTVLYCPFVNNARELGFKQPFAKITMGFLGKNQLSDDDKSTFWEEHKQTMAHKALNVK